MNSKEPEDRAYRTIHLSGGRRAYSTLDKKLSIDPWRPDDASQHFEVTSQPYYAVFNQLLLLGFSPIGCDFAFEEMDRRHASPMYWRSYLPMGRREWPCNDLSDDWSGVAYAAIKAKDAACWDIANRLSHQMQVINWRLRELSEAYRKQLIVQLEGKPGQTGMRFSDTFTGLVYMAFESFLVDAGILRDYLAEFYASALQTKGVDIGAPKITTLKTLKKKYLDKSTDAAHVEVILRTATAEGGWVSELTAYRNLVVHAAPLSLADKSLFAVWTEVPLNGRMVPGLKVPLPENPAEVVKKRSDGSLFDDPNLAFATFANILEDSPKARDALDYAQSLARDLAFLSWHMITVSPYAPKLMHLTIVDGMGVEVEDQTEAGVPPGQTPAQ